MKLLQFLLPFIVVSAIKSSPLSSSSSKLQQLFNPECSKGIAYWCQDIVNADKCNAVNFCIKTVWETHKSVPDSDLICNDCKEWVGKARDLIVRNDESGKIIDTLEWTCDLIPLKSLRESCEGLVDGHVPAILAMLESAMEPEVVCSKLFFCHNADFDRALDQSNKDLLPLTCNQCYHIGTIIEKKFQDASNDEILGSMLGICGELSSYSDSCSNIVMMNFDDILGGIKKQMTSDRLCKASGSCRDQQTRVSLPATSKDPNFECELCQQAVLHLREIILKNTTEIEFKNIMDGFCHQMGQFSDECIDISNQYYQQIFNFMLDKLSANKACILLKICPATEADKDFQVPSMPLLSVNLHPKPHKSGLIEVHMVSEVSSMELHQNGAWCTTCEYFVHYMQEVLKKPAIEDDIEESLQKVCQKLPQKIQHECSAMVDLYGDFIISFWAQNMNPRLICPKVKLCPPNAGSVITVTPEEKPTCPFCLMAMQEIWDIIASNKSTQSIESALSKLCSHLSDKLVGQCNEFVKTYSKEVVDMILADFTPQESCTFIKLCTDDKKHVLNVKIVELEKNDKELGEVSDNPQCQLCKEIVEILEQRVINRKSKDEIRRELEHSCDRLKKFTAQCKKFVDKFSDRIVDLIEKELKPDHVCQELIFCVKTSDLDFQDYDFGLDILNRAVQEPATEIKEAPQCVICEFVMSKLEDDLNDTTIDEEVKAAVKNVCGRMPANVANSCKKFVDTYFNAMIVVLEMMKPSEACAAMKLCPAEENSKMIEGLKSDVYQCGICKGLVERIDTVLEDPYTSANLENLEDKLCEKFAGDFKSQCHEIANNYGLTILNLMKSMTKSEEICFKLELCSGNVTGMLEIY